MMMDEHMYCLIARGGVPPGPGDEWKEAMNADDDDEDDSVYADNEVRENIRQLNEAQDSDDDGIDQVTTDDEKSGDGTDEFRARLSDDGLVSDVSSGWLPTEESARDVALFLARSVPSAEVWIEKRPVGRPTRPSRVRTVSSGR